MSDEPSRDRPSFSRVDPSNARRIFRPKVPALVVSKSDDHGPNVMTAMWWTSAAYRPAQLLLAVEHDCLTYDILRENPEFVLAVPTADMIEAVTVCGRVSGADLDKIDYLDLSLLPPDEIDVPLLESAGGNLECEIVHSHTYEDHTYYFAAPKAVHVRDEWFEDKVYTPDADPLLYLGSRREAGETVRYYSTLSGRMLSSGDAEILENLPDK